jgi:hypothetical protein
MVWYTFEQHIFLYELCTGSLVDKKPARKCYMHTKEKLHKIASKLEHTLQKSLRCFEQEIGILEIVSSHSCKAL